MKEGDRKGEGKDGKGRKLKAKAYEKELAAVQQGRQHFPDVLELRAREVAALAALGRLTDADRIVEEAAVTPARTGSLGLFLVLSAVELRAHGHRGAAQRLAERAVAWFGARPTVGRGPAPPLVARIPANPRGLGGPSLMIPLAPVVTVMSLG